MGHSRLRRDNHGEGLVSDLLDATPTETNRGTTVRELQVGENRHNTTGMATSNDNSSQEGVATDLLGVDDIYLQAGSTAAAKTTTRQGTGQSQATNLFHVWRNGTNQCTMPFVQAPFVHGFA